MWLEYMKSRGVTEKSIRKFDIFSVNAEGKLEGLTDIIKHPEVQKLDSTYNNSIVFPVKDLNNNLKFLAARRFDKDVKFYFPKGCKKTELFGLNVTKIDIIKKGFVFLVEGYFDLLTLYSYGIKNVACCMGNHLSTQQLLRLLILTDKFIVVFDHDEGGEQGLKTLLKRKKDFNFKLKKMILPNGQDPDEFYIKNGIEGWKICLKTLQELV